MNADSLKDLLKETLGRKSLTLVEGYSFLRYQFFYRGNRFFCPCCSSRLGRFISPDHSLAASHKDTTICPRCGSHPRHRMLWMFLEKTRRGLFEKPLSLLHVAPEICYQRQFKHLRRLRYVTADITSPVADCRLDLCRLPFQSGVFDVVLCNHVLEHIPDDRRAMQELCRVLKPGGWGILQVPVDSGRHMTFEDGMILSSEEREQAFGQRDHVRVYGVDYADRLTDAGFTVEVIDFVAEVERDVALRCGLNNDEQVYLCTKPCETSKALGESTT